jgi:hypothetical protein
MTSKELAKHKNLKTLNYSKNAKCVIALRDVFIMISQRAFITQYI